MGAGDRTTCMVIKQKNKKGRDFSQPFLKEVSSGILVELIGIEPTTYALRTHRSPS